MSGCLRPPRPHSPAGSGHQEGSALRTASALVYQITPAVFIRRGGPQAIAHSPVRGGEGMPGAGWNETPSPRGGGLG